MVVYFSIFLSLLFMNIFDFLIRFKICKGKKENKQNIGNNKYHKVFIADWLAYVNKKQFENKR